MENSSVIINGWTQNLENIEEKEILNISKLIKKLPNPNLGRMSKVEREGKKLFYEFEVYNKCYYEIDFDSLIDFYLILKKDGECSNGAISKTIKECHENYNQYRIDI